MVSRKRLSPEATGEQGAEQGSDSEVGRLSATPASRRASPGAKASASRTSKKADVKRAKAVQGAKSAAVGGPEDGGAKTRTSNSGSPKARASKKGSPKPGSSKAGSSKAGSSKAGSFAQGEARPGAPEPGLPPGLHMSPEVFSKLQSDYFKRLAEVFSSAEAPAAPDRRFAAQPWHGGPFAWGAALYSLNAEFLQKMAEAVEGDAKTRDRVKFATQQWVDMLSPANFLLTNPEAQQRLLDTRGESLWNGIQNMLADLQRGRISQTDEEAFEVGRNVATTPGSVVFQNELIQIVQYSPTTERVGSRPILMVPPCINKFYIMDLQPDNSLVAYTVAQGHTVFMVSWRNVQADQSELTWDDYLERGAIEAIRVVREITGQPKINLLGFCVGGTIAATAAAVLAARKEHWVESLTLLTTLLDFADPGVLGIFIDEAFVSYKEATIGKTGLMHGRELATTFNFLRPNDLVWNYVVNSYLKGEAPAAFDLLFWNSDSTNLPGPMYCWYIRHLYLQNELRIPGRLRCAGERVDLGAIGVPTFVYASKEDHIVPWRAGYESTQLMKAPVRFVMGASGHIAGVINPAHRNKRNYWVGETCPASADEWLSQAREVPGSWWPDWSRWLSQFGGEPRLAPRSPGSVKYRALEAAPGSYVKQKA
jgi:polyhydroxyalkanoate synthase